VKIIVINRYFFPDSSATSQLASTLAFALAAAGWDVKILSSRQLYGDPAAALGQLEWVQGVAIHRLWTSRFGRRNLLGRLFDYVTFYVGAFLWLLIRARPGDIFITLTDPPLLAVVSSAVAALRRCRQINWLQDLFPEVAYSLGVLSPTVPHKVLVGLRNLALQHADMNVAISDRMLDYVRSQGIQRSRSVAIHNWTDGREVYPREPHESQLRSEWGLQGKFVVGYSGNLGRAHELETILEAAKLLAHDQGVQFLFVGDGHLFSSLRDQVKSHALNNVSIRPYQPRAQLGDTLAVPDVHLISLKPALESFVMPSKLYGILAAGRPVFFVGDADGEIPGILQRADCGIGISIGDGISLARQIEHLRRNLAQRERWGRNARILLERNFDQALIIPHWLRLVASVAAASPNVRGNRVRGRSRRSRLTLLRHEARGSPRDL
jgi:glycosyltransferase involved in cell wall biosynthesis